MCVNSYPKRTYRHFVSVNTFCLIRTTTVHKNKYGLLAHKNIFESSDLRSLSSKWVKNDKIMPSSDLQIVKKLSFQIFSLKKSPNWVFRKIRWEPQDSGLYVSLQANLSPLTAKAHPTPKILDIWWGEKIRRNLFLHCCPYFYALELEISSQLL